MVTPPVPPALLDPFGEEALEDHVRNFTGGFRHLDNDLDEVLFFMNGEAQEGTALLFALHHLAHFFYGMNRIDKFQLQTVPVMIAQRRGIEAGDPTEACLKFR